MSRLSKKDLVMLSEAYSAQIIEESAPYMTIGELQQVIPTMTLEEARVIEELFGKVGQKIGQVASGLGAVGGAIGKSAGNVAGRVADKAKSVASGVASAGKQMGQNVSNIYNASVTAKESEQAVKNAFNAASELVDLVKKAQANGLVKSQSDVVDMTLADIMNELQTAQQSAGTFKSGAENTGIGGGVGTAFQTGAQ